MIQAHYESNHIIKVIIPDSVFLGIFIFVFIIASLVRLFLRFFVYLWFVKNNSLRFILVSLIALLVIVLGLTYSGFCFKQFRYIPDDEKVRIAIEFILKENREAVIQYKERAVVYPFNTADEFLASNPISCCGASGSLRGGMDWVDKMCGHLSSYVVFEFMGVYKNNPRKVLGNVAITNCGDVWNTDD